MLAHMHLAIKTRFASMGKLVKIATCITVAVILLVLVAVGLFLNTRQKPVTCNLDDNQPHLDYRSAVNVPSPDFRGLAAFLGYLKYPEDPTQYILRPQYMTLELNTVVVSKDSLQIAFETDCALVNFALNSNTFNNKTTINVREIDIYLTRPSIGKYICTGNSFVKDIEWPLGSHYYCAIRKEYVCRAKATNIEIVTFVIEFLEFELSDKPDLTAQSIFSTPQSVCS